MRKWFGFTALLALLSVNAVGQLYVEGDYSGTTSNMGCTSRAKYMSGTLNWTIDVTKATTRAMSHRFIMRE